MVLINKVSFELVAVVAVCFVERIFVLLCFLSGFTTISLVGLSFRQSRVYIKEICWVMLQ